MSRIVIVLCFNCFCLGAILAEQLLRRGITDLAFCLGLPAFLLQLTLLGIVNWKEGKL